MKHLKSFESTNHSYQDGDRVKCIKKSIVNLGSRYDPNVGDVFTIENEDLLGDTCYFLINSDNKKLTYPYRKYELDIYFELVK